MIGGIWDDKYVCELGIFEHLNECVVLRNEWQRVKAVVPKNSSAWKDQVLRVRRQLDNELADLHILLMKYFSFEKPGPDNRPMTVAERMNRFEEKANGAE